MHLGNLQSILAITTLLLITTSQSQHLENDIHSLLDGGGGGGDEDFEVELQYKPEESPLSLHTPQQQQQQQHEEKEVVNVGVRRLWGIEDTHAFIGRVFQHFIPRDAFQGDVQEYRVKGLPSWLAWDSIRGVVEGVARPTDRGHHYVTVRAVGSDGSHAKDVFAVDVHALPGSFLSHEGSCGSRSDVTVLSLLLDAHLSSLSPLHRLNLLRAANDFMGINASLVPASRDADPLGTDAALQAGPGSAKMSHTSRHSSKSLTQLQWVVGCDGDVRKSFQQGVDKTELEARNGKLERLLGLPVLGWHITQVNPKSKRVRRQADYSGDFNIDSERDGEYDYNNYDYSNYDYSYDNEETGKVLNFDYEMEPQPETRVIPSLATPTFPEASESLVPRVHPDPSLHFSPVFISTPVYVPEKPTRILEASPTVTYESSYPTELPYPSLEGSIVTQPSSVVTTTPHLTTTTTTPAASSSEPISPSTVHTHTVTESTYINYQPRVKNRIQKLAWIAGHVYRLRIPADTFEDFEDGDTRNLKLSLKTNRGLPLGRNSSIQFNPTTQEIYALPLENHMGRYNYVLEAMDSEGKSATETIVIHVQQPREGRNFNHRFAAVFKREEKFENDLEWQIKAVEKIAHLYGDPDTENINVRAISSSPSKITWTNTSLANPRSTICPTDELEAVAEVVIGGDEHGMTREFQEAFRPEFQLMRVHVHYMGHCSVLQPKHKPHGPARRPDLTTTKEEKEKITETENTYSNSQPTIRNPIDLLNATAGTLLRYQVPEDTCYDFEDGDSHKLKMRLLTASLTPIPPDSWLQFDLANHEFYGIPLAGNVGKMEYNLECVDSGGMKVIDALFVNVLKRPTKGLVAAKFSITLDQDYQEFMTKAHLKAKLVESIAAAFGDPNPAHVSIEDMRAGSVVVTWHNSSLPADPCPEEEIKRLSKVMLDDDGNLLQTFIEAFGDDYKVTDGSLTPSGVCLGGVTPTHIEEEQHQPPVDDTIEGDDNDYLINFIIPAVIIAAMLLIAAIIACCLYRRRRYGKMTMTDDRTFVTKGIPIIFAEELDDRPDPAKSPVIMKEEKPPLPPPEYQRGHSPSNTSTPPTTNRRPHNEDDAPSYQPPPPFTSNGGGGSRNPRPNMPPTYRKPPTYVPP